MRERLDCGSPLPLSNCRTSTKPEAKRQRTERAARTPRPGGPTSPPRRCESVWTAVALYRFRIAERQQNRKQSGRGLRGLHALHALADLRARLEDARAFG